MTEQPVKDGNGSVLETDADGHGPEVKEKPGEKLVIMKEAEEGPLLAGGAAYQREEAFEAGEEKESLGEGGRARDHDINRLKAGGGQGDGETAAKSEDTMGGTDAVRGSAEKSEKGIATGGFSSNPAADGGDETIDGEETGFSEHRVAVKPSLKAEDLVSSDPGRDPELLGVIQEGLPWEHLDRPLFAAAGFSFQQEVQGQASYEEPLWRETVHHVDSPLSALVEDPPGADEEYAPEDAAPGPGPEERMARLDPEARWKGDEEDSGEPEAQVRALGDNPAETEEEERGYEEPRGLFTGLFDEGSLVSEVLTPWSNRTPLTEEYLEGLASSAVALGRAENKEDIYQVRDAGLTVSLPADPDIVVNLLLREEEPRTSFTLSKRLHPMKRGRKKAEGVNFLEGSKAQEGGGLSKTVTVVRMSAGTYTFTVTNTGTKALSAELAFLLYGAEAGGKRAVELEPGEAVRFMFILPEAVFWDDEDCFTGSIESPDSVTRFNDETGLVWKEEKDR